MNQKKDANTNEKNSKEVSEEGFEIMADQEVLKGNYSNIVRINHSAEEFKLDFLVQSPEELSKLVSRIFVSPGHMKRLLHAIKRNVERYEENFGQIDPSKGPTSSEGG